MLGGVGGSGSEGKLAKVYEELTTTLREKDEADNKISALTLEVDIKLLVFSAALCTV